MTDTTSSTPHTPGRTEQRLDAAISRFNRWPDALRKVLVVISCVIGTLLLVSIVSAPRISSLALGMPCDRLI